MRRMMLAVAVATVAALLGAGAAVAVTTTAGTTIRACAKLEGGALRLAASCRADERPVSWATTGPQGVPGPRGPRGPAGPAGTAVPYKQFVNATTFRITSTGCEPGKWRLVVARQWGSTLQWAAPDAYGGCKATMVSSQGLPVSGLREGTWSLVYEVDPTFFNGLLGPEGSWTFWDRAMSPTTSTSTRRPFGLADSCSVGGWRETSLLWVSCTRTLPTDADFSLYEDQEIGPVVFERMTPAAG